MNQQLQSLYAAKWDQLCMAMRPVIADTTLEVKPTSPLLLSMRNEESFQRADIRVMVYGRETNSWYGEFHEDMPDILDNYNKFFTEGECWRYGGQFWNGVKRFMELLQKQYPTKTLGLVWNNLVKIGKHDDMGFPPDYIHEVERECFAVHLDELRIIKPNVVLFLSGPKYDGVLVDDFGPLAHFQRLSVFKQSETFSERQIVKVSLPNVLSAYRTYHPNYLWRNDINRYFQTILDQISIDLA